MERRLEVMNMLSNLDGEEKDTENCNHASFGCLFPPLFSQCSVAHIQLLWIHRETYSLQPTPSTSRWCVFLNRESCLKENIQVGFFLHSVAVFRF